MKSALINDLLVTHYNSGKPILNPYTGLKRKPNNEGLVDNVVAVGKALGVQEKLCLNGHPIPEGRSKCLGKGCKYS